MTGFRGAVWRRLRGWMERNIRFVLNLYPPYLGAGVHIPYMAADFREIHVEMAERPWTRNYMGTHFGGSLYAMCDPFYMLMLIKNLGPEFLVWDQAATIRFVKPGRGRMRAEFQLSPAQIEEVRERALREGRTHATYAVRVQNEAGETVAEVDKVIYVRALDPSPPPESSRGATPS